MLTPKPPKDRAEELVVIPMVQKALDAWLSRPKGTKAIPAMRLAILAAFEQGLTMNRFR